MYCKMLFVLSCLETPYFLVILKKIPWYRFLANHMKCQKKGRGVKKMENNQKKTLEIRKSVLNTLEYIARKNASALCKGFIYEPEVPRKLKK